MTAVADRVSQLLEGSRRRRSEIQSPEGIALPIEVASFGDRVVAFMLDLVFWTLASTAILILLFLGGSAAGLALVGESVALFLAFLIRNLYMIHFELAWRGATPGKRIVGLRVIDRHGGPLLPGAIIARNLTREVELFLPLGLLATAGTAVGWSLWMALSLGLWMLLLTLLPLFNRDRLRVGDMLGGTLVVAMPRRMLLQDLAAREPRFTFAKAQLQAYGAFELQVLEELLRRGEGPAGRKLRLDVADKICRKIGWTAPLPDRDVDEFLGDFYAAERAFLEREQLYGRPKASKDATPPPIAGG
jgi:uncharacterized RDD family membrane protein YckC